MTNPPKTIWVSPYEEMWANSLASGYDVDAEVSVSEPDCGAAYKAHYTLTSHAEAEKRKAVNDALERAAGKAKIDWSSLKDRQRALNLAEEIRAMKVEE